MSAFGGECVLQPKCLNSHGLRDGRHALLQFPCMERLQNNFPAGPVLHGGIMTSGMVTMVLATAWWRIEGWPTADEWQAFGSVATLLVAVVAAGFAWQQVSDARALRREQAQPYVAAYLDLNNEVDFAFMTFVIKNFGLTAAHDIRISIDPPMKRAWGTVANPEPLDVASTITMLVPGQEWKTLFDWAPHRLAAKLYDVYTVKIQYKDSHGKEMPAGTFTIDWNQYRTMRKVGVKTTHDIGKAVQEIEKTLKKWTQGASGPLSVHVRDGDARDKREAEWFAQGYREEQETQQRESEVETNNELTDSWSSATSTGAAADPDDSQAANTEH